MKNKKKLFLFLAIIVVIVLGLQAWFDEKLFTEIQGGNGKSNVIFIQDCTGSMCQTIYHPDFNVMLNTGISFGTNASINNISKTLWYIRWYTQSNKTINASNIYATVHSFTAPNTLVVYSEGINIKAGDWILQYDPNNPEDKTKQAKAKVTACSVPDANKRFTLTLDNLTIPSTIQGNFTPGYRLYIWAQNATIVDYDSGSNVLRVAGDIRSYFNINDYIMLYDKDNVYTTGRQVTAKITAKSYSSSSGGRTSLTLADIKGTISISSSGQDRVYYRMPSVTTLACLYGTNIDQGNDPYDEVGYVRPDEQPYLKWVFGVANDSQRQQISDFSTLGHDVDYNAYLRPTPVSPTVAYALNMDNTNKSKTLLEEWNEVMKSIYPNKIANLTLNINDTVTTNIAYTGAKDTFKNYSSGFYIKIDAETMWVDSNTPSIDPLKKGQGTLNVTRQQNNTTKAAHSAGVAIMIYNQDASPTIDESTPLTSLFSSMQHVDEPTGDVNPAFMESKNINGTNKLCYRYKRVFTRIQVAREAMCDVITAKNKLFKVADLAADYSNSSTELTYRSGTDLLTRIAPFYIKVSDPANPGDDEIMKVTNNDPATTTLTVTRASNAFPHNENSLISTYSGARDMVRFGIFNFPVNDTQGGLTSNLLVPLKDFGQKNTNGTYKTDAYINSAILDSVNTFRSDETTPLAKALSLVWNYLKPNSGTGPGSYIQQNSTGWEAVDSLTFGTNEKFENITIDGVTHPHPKGSPMEYHCQKNFAVMITDGVSNSDSDLTNPDGRYGVFSQSSRKTDVVGYVISDFFKFNYNRSSYPTPWGDTVNDGTEYLTDVAYFLAHQDMFPTSKIKTGTWDTTADINGTRNNYYSEGTDEADATLYDKSNTDPYKQWPNNQNIKTYTVGLCVANAVLPKAAKNGDGESFTASNYRDLSDAFLNIITTVELSQTPTSYTTYAAPKQSITTGNYGYIAHFKPGPKTMWEGHLRRYQLSATGAFPADTSHDSVSFLWDAGIELNNRTAPRVVHTSEPPSTQWGIWPSAPLDFMSTSIDYNDLGVTSAQVLTVKNFIQNFNKADGINANSDYKGLYRLGETFHFNPQLVGYPLAWKASFDASYSSFYNKYAVANPRKEVVYTGANDGKLHCFESDNGNELWSYVPFALLKFLKNTVTLVNSPDDIKVGKHTYFVDGKSVVKDIKVSTTFTGENAWRNWKTGLFFGLGIGGRSYCALDVTNPADLKILWETEDDAETVTNGNMGFTEAKPVVVDMYAGSTLGYFPAAILAGGYNAAEVQATDTDAQLWQRREGKALYILNANTGALVKKFIYGTTLADTGNATNGYVQTNPGFLTAMTAAPAVFDKNNDGIADVIYLAESGDYQVANAHGGAIWKINCYGDPSDWKAQKIYQADHGQTIFISPSLAYDADYRVWVMFGTGRRPQPAEGLGTGTGFKNMKGQFVAFIDDDSVTYKTNTDLHNAATSGTTEYTIDNSSTVKKGFFFNFLLENEIMFEPQPLYVNNKVYFMTFTPSEGTGSSGSENDPCGGSSVVNGSHYIYQFKLTSQGNTFVIGNFLHQSGKILGYGPIGDTFTIYVGSGDAGSFESIESVRKNEKLQNNNEALLWKEDKK